MTREDRRLAKRCVILMVLALGGLWLVGVVNLWLYPPPNWASDAIKLPGRGAMGSMCMHNGLVTPCRNLCKVEGKWEFCEPQ